MRKSETLLYGGKISDSFDLFTGRESNSSGGMSPTGKATLRAGMSPAEKATLRAGMSAAEKATLRVS